MTKAIKAPQWILIYLWAIGLLWDGRTWSARRYQTSDFHKDFLSVLTTFPSDLRNSQYLIKKSQYQAFENKAGCGILMMAAKHFSENDQLLLPPGQRWSQSYFKIKNHYSWPQKRRTKKQIKVHSSLNKKSNAKIQGGLIYSEYNAMLLKS